MNYEYKVVTRTPDPLNGGKFQAAKLEQILNYYAQDGWTVVSITSAIASLQAQQTNQASQLSSQQSAINNLQSTQATHTSQISDLQTQQTNQAQAINYLQNSAAKQLKVYDANGQELGIAIDHAG